MSILIINKCNHYRVLLECSTTDSRYPRHEKTGLRDHVRDLKQHTQLYRLARTQYTHTQYTGSERLVRILKVWLLQESFLYFKPTAIPLRFEIMFGQILAETARAQQKRSRSAYVVVEAYRNLLFSPAQNLRSDIAMDSKRNGSVVTSQ